MWRIRRSNRMRKSRRRADAIVSGSRPSRLTETIAAEADLARRYARLTSMPGVGPVLAFTLIALLPELGRMSRKQIAAQLCKINAAPLEGGGQSLSNMLSLLPNPKVVSIVLSLCLFEYRSS